MEKDTTIQEMRKGLLVIAVLQTIGSKKCYAAEILAQLEDTEFATQEGTLYPLLSRLKREKYIEYEWVESPSGPPRKYYLLSKLGKQRLTELLGYIGLLRKQLKQIGGNDE